MPGSMQDIPYRLLGGAKPTLAPTPDGFIEAAAQAEDVHRACLEFNGLTDSARLPVDIDLGIGNEWSVMLWVLPTQLEPPDTETLFEIHNLADAGDNANSFRVDIKSSGEIVFRAFTSGGASFKNFKIDSLETGLSGIDGWFFAGSWSQIVVTWDGSDFNMYRNGYLMNSDMTVVTDTGGAQTNTNRSISVGSKVNGLDFFTGFMHSAAYWSEALTQGAIRQIWNQGCGSTFNLNIGVEDYGPSTHDIRTLEAWWQLGKDTTAPVRDWTNNNKNLEVAFSGISLARFQFEDSIFNTTSLSFVETGVSIVPEAGINVIFFRANASAGSEGVTGASLQATYAGSEIGVSLANTSVQVGHWNSIELHGWKVIDCDGTSEVKLLAKSNTGARSVDVGTQQLISLPLEGWGFVEDTHYSVQQSEATTTFAEVFSVLVTIDTFEFTVPTTGKYLVLWYAEGAQAEFAALGEFVIYGYSDDPEPGESARSQHQARESISGVADQFHSWAWSEIRTLNSGTNSISVRARRWNGFTDVSIKRPRMLVISMDAFQGTAEGVVSFTDTSTTSNSFVENTAMARTHNSASREEQVLVIVNQTSEQNNAVHPGGSSNNVDTYKIRDDTLGVDYAIDSGERVIDFFSNRNSHMFFALKENASGDTDWKVFIREANNTGGFVTVTYGSISVLGLTPDV